MLTITYKNVSSKNLNRLSLISAIHKKGNESELCSYRPVSLTCIICQLMEKEVIVYLLDHFWAITSSAIVNKDS